MITRITALITAVVAWGCIGSASARAADAPRQTGAPRPHIVYILSDDQGLRDAGFQGSDIATPSLDALAQGGVRLERFYAQPMCTPSRAALLTGRYPHRYGLQTLVIPSAGTYGLATDERLLSQALRDAGYRTAIVGKWHLGHADRKYWPRQRGFDYQYGPMLGEIDYYTHTAHGVRDWFRDNERVVEEGYVTELIGNDAVRLIERHDPATPLFLYLTFTAPHAPYQAPQAYLDKYAHVEDPARRAYAAMISAMDTQIGRVVQALEARGMRENTLIVFQSDNGGPRSAMFTGEVDMSKSTIPADNSPYRDGKASLYEGGTRVLALANWPGRIAANSVVKERIHIVDMFPTLVALAGGTTAGGKPLDGMDVWPTMAKGAPSPRKEVVYGIEPYRAGLSQGDWKLVWRAILPEQVELFDLGSDPGEKVDLAAKKPEVVAALKQRIAELAKDGTPPLIVKEAIGALQGSLFGSVILAGDEPAPEDVAAQP